MRALVQPSRTPRRAHTERVISKPTRINTDFPLKSRLQKRVPTKRILRKKVDLKIIEKISQKIKGLPRVSENITRDEFDELLEKYELIQEIIVKNLSEIDKVNLQRILRKLEEWFLPIVEPCPNFLLGQEKEYELWIERERSKVTNCKTSYCDLELITLCPQVSQNTISELLKRHKKHSDLFYKVKSELY